MKGQDSPHRHDWNLGYESTVDGCSVPAAEEPEATPEVRDVGSTRGTDRARSRAHEDAKQRASAAGQMRRTKKDHLQPEDEPRAEYTYSPSSSSSSHPRHRTQPRQPESLSTPASLPNGRAEVVKRPTHTVDMSTRRPRGIADAHENMGDLQKLFPHLSTTELEETITLCDAYRDRAYREHGAGPDK